MGLIVRIWTLTDGKAGDQRQVEGLAAALSEALLSAGAPPPDIESHIVRRDTRGDLAMLLPAMLAMRALPPAACAQWRAQPPDLAIGCGRRANAILAALKRRRAALMAVAVMNPRASLGRFDLVLPPAHDRLEGPNIMPLVGPPIHFSAPSRAAIETQWRALADEPGRKIAVLVGGDSKAHRLREADLAALLTALMALDDSGLRLWIAVSRRTPGFAVRRLREFARKRALRFWAEAARDGPNPYLGFLTYCDALIVTEDSVNMACEAGFFGRPVHIFPLTGGSAKFSRFHSALRAREITRPFRGAIEAWTYPPLREGARAAAAILARLPA